MEPQCIIANLFEFHQFHLIEFGARGSTDYVAEQIGLSGLLRAGGIRSERFGRNNHLVSVGPAQSQKIAHYLDVFRNLIHRWSKEA